MSLDRATLSSTQLYQLAAREGIALSQQEKERVSPDYLYLLAITNKVGLSQHDRDRLKPLHLAHLAVTERIVLSRDDKSRLPMALLFTLFDQGIVDLSEREMACYRVVPLESQKELKTMHSKSLVPA